MIATTTPKTTSFHLIETPLPWFAADGMLEAAAAAWLEAESRVNRLKAVGVSDAYWYLRLRFFFKHLFMIFSSFPGMSGLFRDGGDGERVRSGLIRVGGTGERSRIALKIKPKLSPRNGMVPVAISYSTTPNENKSVRASSSLARTCSGDM